MLATLAAQFADRLVFAKVNVDEAPDLAQRFEITGVPTLLLFQNGELCDEIVGVPSPKALSLRLEQFASGQSAGSCLTTPGSSC